jgi:hypothetical protein
MYKTINDNQNIITFGIPLTLILSSILLAKSPIFQLYPDEISIGITFDLILTVPIVYYLLICKKNISKITTVPFFIAGIVVASFILPKDYQFYLSEIKYWVLPIVETTVFIIIVFKVRKTIQLFKKQKTFTPDFYSALKIATSEVLPKKISPALATEVAVIYYGFFNWKQRVLNDNEFSYHIKSGTITLLSVFIFMIILEMSVIHVLLQKWSNTAAWILSILSFYAILQVFGFLRSMGKRPVTIEDDRLILRYGLLSESIIFLDKIDSIEVSRKPIDPNKLEQKLSPLKDFESHNIILHLKTENSISGLYGIQQTYKSIAFHIDHKEKFVKKLKNVLKQRG